MRILTTYPKQMVDSKPKQFQFVTSTVRICLLLFLCLNSIIAMSQSDCPSGYSMRKVKCGGIITEKCVPNDYSCKSCWIVSWKPCPGKSSGGDDWYNSYDAALSNAEKKANGSNWSSGKCIWWDNNPGQYTIYIDDASLCGTLNSACALCEDLKLKASPFIDRYKAEIKAYKNMINGKLNMPKATFDEYSKLIDQAETKIKKLDFELKSLNDKNYDVVNSLFEELEKDQQELKNVFATIPSGQPSQSNSSSESNSACDLYWTDWVQCLTSPKGSVSYRIQFSKKFCGCGYQFVQIKHSFSYKVSIDLELEGWDCDGKYLKSKFSTTTISSNEISADNGNWHRFGKIKGAFAVKVKGNDGNGNREISIGPNGAQEYINGKSVAEIENEKRQEQIKKNVIKTEQEGKEINKIVEGNTSAISQSYIKSMTELNNQAARSGLTVDNTALRIQANKIAEANKKNEAISQSIDNAVNSFISATIRESQIEMNNFAMNMDRKRALWNANSVFINQCADSAKYFRESNKILYAENILKRELAFLRGAHAYGRGVITYLKFEKTYKYYKIIDPLKCFMWFDYSDYFTIWDLIPIDVENFNLPAYCIAPIQNVFTNEYQRKNIYQEALFNLRKENKSLTFFSGESYYYLKPKFNKNLNNDYDEAKAMTKLKLALEADSIENSADVFDFYLCLMWHNCLKTKNTNSYENILSILTANLEFFKKADKLYVTCTKEEEKCTDLKNEINSDLSTKNMQFHMAGSQYVLNFFNINTYYYLRALYVTMRVFPEKEEDISKLIENRTIFPGNLIVNFLSNKLTDDSKSKYFDPNSDEIYNSNYYKKQAKELEELIKYIQSKLNSQ
jgi:hypothetical protein